MEEDFQTVKEEVKYNDVFFSLNKDILMRHVQDLEPAFSHAQDPCIKDIFLIMLNVIFLTTIFAII